MRIHVCVRATLDWWDRECVETHILPQFRPKLEAWNATFDMPYHVFRARLRQIALLNVSLVEGATCSAISEVGSGDVIVPIDDDDWLAPDLVGRLRSEYEPTVRCYLWTREVIEPISSLRYRLERLARRLGRRDPLLCRTNNYAVVSEPELIQAALSHGHASRYFAARPPSEIRRMTGTLAIQNRTLASQTTLAWRRPSIGREELANLLHRYKRLYASWKLAPELSWARPYVDMMAELMQDIRLA
jgi:hypothetical protein